MSAPGHAPRASSRAPAYWAVLVPPSAACSRHPSVEFAPADEISDPLLLAGGSVKILSHGRRPVPLQDGVVVRPMTPAELRAATQVH